MCPARIAQATDTLFTGRSSSSPHDLSWPVLCLLTLLGFASTCFAQQPTWTPFTPSGSGPRGGGGSQSTAYDPTSDTLIVFGGYNPTVSPCCGETNDVWVLMNASGTGGLPTWQKVIPNAPSGLPQPRQAHSAVYDPTSNRLIIFGGGQVGGGAFATLFQDTWVLTYANNIGGTPEWIPLTPSGGPPAPREGHAAVYHQATNEMFVFGGGNNGIMSVPNDLWVLEDANGIGTPTWIQLSEAGNVPSPLENFASAYDQSDNLWTVVGGCCYYTNASRVLALNQLAGTPQWTNLSPSGTLPPGGDAMVYGYDPLSNRMIVHGILPGGGANATWILTNANAVGATPSWINLIPEGAPGSPSEGANRVGSAYNPGTKKLIHAVTLMDTLGNLVPEVWVLSSADGTPAPTWTQKFPTTSPPARTEHGMAYDKLRKETVLFGGVGINGQLLNDTWVWDGTNWTQRFPVNSPPGKSRFSMTYDEARAQVVLFGGDTSSSGTGNDTWVWDGTNWTQKFPSTSPSARFSHAMAYDAGRAQVVLFGGYGPQGTSWVLHDDTWVWDGTNWLQELPSVRPPARSDHALAYDAGRAEIVLFGGGTTSITFAFGDTWVWDGTNWSQKPPASSPTPRIDPTMAYDAARDRVMLFGGMQLGPAVYVTDTWVWDGATWTEEFPTTSPSIRVQHRMAYDDFHSLVVLFGGHNQPVAGELGDTWVWGPATPVTLPAPAISSVSPSSGTQGQTITNLTVTGVNFNPNATLSFGGSGITVNSYSLRTSTEIQAVVGISASAPVGAQDVIVTNPDGQQAKLSAAFTILVAPPVTRTLTVASTNPSSGVPLSVNLLDNNNLGDGTTQFARTYNNGVTVTLGAPASTSGNNFSSWNGCDSTAGANCTVTLSADRTVTANYVTPPPPAMGAVGLSCPQQSASGCLSLYVGSEVIVTSVPAPPPSSFPNQTVVVTNTGTAPLIIQYGPQVTGDFAESDNCVSLSPLATNASCLITVTFAPTSSGLRKGTLSIGSNVVQLSGYGINSYYQGACISHPGNDTVPCPNYDNDNSNCPTNQYGCALVSSGAMLTAFNPSATPKALDAALSLLPPGQGYCSNANQSSSYDPCFINWTAVPTYAQSIGATLGLARSFDNWVGQGNLAHLAPIAQSSVLQYLNNEFSNTAMSNQVAQTILELCFVSGPGGPCVQRMGTHYVLALGPIGQNDWAIFDPGWEKGSTYPLCNTVTTTECQDPNEWTLMGHLDGFTTSVSQKTILYFAVTGYRTYVTATSPSKINVTACSPVEFLITDPNGLQLGAQTTGNDIFEIPSASYIRNYPLGGDDGGGLSIGEPTGTKEASVPTPVAGVYTVVATGSDFGNYNLNFSVFASDGSSQLVSMNGFAAPGSIATYSFAYDSTPGAPMNVSQQPVGPQLGLAVNTVSFGSLSVGTSSAPQPVGIADTGTSALTISGISISGPASNDFSIASGSTCLIRAGTLAAASSCVTDIIFTPSAVGARNATLTIVDNAPGSPHKVNLVGTATPGFPTISWPAPSPITYGTPLGSMQLNATANVPGSFAYNPPTGTLLHAGSQTLSVTFSPSDATDYSTTAAQVTLQVNQATPVIAWTPASIQLGYALGAAQLDATTGVPGTFTYTPPFGTVITTSSQTLSVLFTPTDTTDYTTARMSVPLTVTPGPLASVSPSSIDFGTVYLGTITVKRVTVSNQGNATMTITDPFLSIVSGGDSKEFVMANLCPKPLAAGKSCTIAVGFVAGPHYIPQTATIKVIDNAPGSPQTVNLTATVINPQADLEPERLSFGTQPVNSITTKTVTLTNTGATALSITNIAVTGPNTADFMQASACPSSLAAGASCKISITFTPLSKNTFAAGLTVTDNAVSGKQTVPLTGKGH